MNRRNFLQRSGFAMVAAAGLPYAIRKTSDEKFHIYSAYEEGKKSDVKQAIVVNHILVEAFYRATETDKIVTYSYKELAKDYSLLKEGRFNFTAEQAVSSGNASKIRTYSTGRIEGDYTLPKKFPSDMHLFIKPLDYLEIQSKKGKTYARLRYDSVYETSSGSGCFLTTACVQHKNLPDDCDELQTLRGLRDNYMRTTEEGQWLIQQYKALAPGIVYAIDQCENKGEIYEYMYRNMISPAVQLVKEGELQEATDHYMLFVKALKEKYC